VPSEQLEMARRGFEAFNRGEFDVLIEMLHEDVVAEVPEPFAAADLYRGPGGFAKMLREWSEPWDEVSIDVHDLIEDGDVVYAPSTQHGRGRGSGVVTSMPTVFLVRFRERRIVFLRLCVTLEEAREHARDI
jgi:ketosteroid isomerase-like protein